jgi:polyisoprenoid-binding protein YceI
MPAAATRPALRTRLALGALLLGLAGPPAWAEPPIDLAVRPGSTVSYHLVHKLHAVTGLARAVEGKVRLRPGGGVQAMVRAGVAAFDSGNANRDAHVLEVTEAARFPLVVLKAAGSLPPGGDSGTAELTLAGEVTFHGVTRPVEVPVRVTFESPRRATATGQLTLSLDAFGVERPSLLFVKVDDALVVTAALTLEAEPP